MISTETRFDFEALASDGQYWRQVYGGARLVWGCVRLSPTMFTALRLTMCGVSVATLVLETNEDPIGSDSSWWLTFEHWTQVLHLVYFGFASVLTVVATCSGGGIARSTPFVVRVTELAYGALIPAAAVNFLIGFLVTYARRSSCIAIADTVTKPKESVIYAGMSLGSILVDATFSRQPYYASFHAVAGLVWCLGWLLFSGLWEWAGGRNQYGNSYILRCLDWSYPVRGGGNNAEGKLLILNFLIVVPVFNYLYWLLLWARRRTLDRLYRTPAAAAAEKAPGFVNRRKVLQYAADFRDLSLDGKHWQAQFGGSSGRGPKMGAYICCNETTYPLMRFIACVAAVSMITLRIWDYGEQVSASDQHKVMLYFNTWLLIVSALYFTMAFLLTTYAALATGAESPRGAPILVWFTWALHGMVFPAAFVNAVLYCLVSAGQTTIDETLDLIFTVVTLFMVLIDAWINRQPYYASFHGLLGCAFCYAYLAFNVGWVLSGGTDADGHDYIYSAFKSTSGSLAKFFTAGKVSMFEMFVLLPFLNLLYWCMLWARRRARVAQMAAAKMAP